MFGIMLQRQRGEGSIPMQTKFSSATHQNSLIKQPDEETLGDLSKQCIMALINTAPFAIIPQRVQNFLKSI